MTRFSKFFQLFTIALVIAVVNVYVMGAPMRTGTDLKKDAAAAKDVAPVTVTPVAVAAEKLSLVHVFTLQAGKQFWPSNHTIRRCWH